MRIRPGRRDDTAAVEALYPAAFPDEDLLPLVRELLRDTGVALSLVGTIDGRVAAHAILTRCGVRGHRLKAALLGPLAVAPARQRQGLGSAIVRAGLRYLQDEGVSRVLVLGDPGYYGRLGFVAETSIEPPYPLPAEWAGAWQSQALGETATVCAGKLSVPRQWLRPALWAP